jgi:transposase-like protein
MTRTRARYSPDLKDRVVRRILSGESTLTSVAAETKIAKGVLSKWVKSARIAALGGQAEAREIPPSRDAATLAVLEGKIRRLESSVQTLRKLLADSYARKASLRFPAET